jgi:[protein-PII] uridylyltransferase
VANAYALRDGRVLDEFQITDAKGAAITEKGQLERIKQRIIDVHSGKLHQVSKVSMQFDVLMESVPVSVRHHEAAALSLTAVEVVAADRKGLLSLLAKAISDVGVSIRGANITTFGAQAVDVFFLSDQDGKKLDKSTLASVISNLESVAQLEKTYQTKLED